MTAAHARAGRRPPAGSTPPASSASTSGSRRSPPRCAAAGLDPGRRLAARSPRPRTTSCGGVVTDLDGAAVAARASGRPARSPAPACTAPTGWPRTRCSRAWCSAPGSVEAIEAGRTTAPAPPAPCAPCSTAVGRAADHRRDRLGRRRRRPLLDDSGPTGRTARRRGPARRSVRARPPAAGHDRRRRRAAHAPSLARRHRAVVVEPRLAVVVGRRADDAGSAADRWPSWRNLVEVGRALLTAATLRARRAGAPTPGPTSRTPTDERFRRPHRRLERADARLVAMTTALDPPRVAPSSTPSTRALAEDLTPLGDLTSALLPPTTCAPRPRSWRAAPGVLAGRACADRDLPPGRRRPSSCAWSADDGDARRGRRGARPRSPGPLASILTAERTALNFLGHLSGIATLTRALRRRGRAPAATARVWDTRKTTPGLRVAREGGGAGRRRGQPPRQPVGLDPAEGQPPRAAWASPTRSHGARDRWPARTVHVECDRLDQVREALDAGADALLLDNMTPDEVRPAWPRPTSTPPPPAGAARCSRCRAASSLETDRRATPALGVDCISVGGLTNSAPVLDIGLDIDPTDRLTRPTAPPTARPLTATPGDPVLLAIDAGNTQTVVGLYDLDGPEPADAAAAPRTGCSTTGASPPRPTAPATSWRCCCRASSPLRGFTLDDIDGMAVSSGVPRVTASLRDCWPTATSTSTRSMIEPGVRTGIAILATRTPRRSAPTASPTRWPPTTCTAARRSSPTSARPPPATRSRPTASTSAGPSPPASSISMDALVGRAAALRRGRAGRAPQRARQEHGRVASSPARSTASPPRSTACASASRTSWASAPSSPPAAWPS